MLEVEEYNSNTLIGYKVGYYGSNVYSNNTALGYEAGYNFDGNNNIAIGWKAGETLTKGSNNIVIGYDIDTLSNTADNYMNIGGLLFGDLSTASAKYLGIGDTSPAYTLSVDGTASVSGTTYLGDTYFSGVVSASDTGGILVGEGVKITAGTASISGACGTAGSLYIRTGQTGIDTVLSICDLDGWWNPTDL